MLNKLLDNLSVNNVCAFVVTGYLTSINSKFFYLPAVKTLILESLKSEIDGIKFCSIFPLNIQ